MRRPGEWQNEFASALINPYMPVPPGLTDPLGEPAPPRFGVYRNNVVRGLVEALKDKFPVACRIVGADCFEAMARAYALQNPPRSPILLEYGAGFAEFIERFEPVASLPYLGGGCRIEQAWLDAYHAPEAEPLRLDELGAIPSADIPDLQLKLHPSIRLIRSRFPALTIWNTNIEGATPIPVDLEAGGEDVLIVRPGSDVEVRGLTHAEMDFVAALSEGFTIQHAAQLALDVDPEFALEAALGGLLGAGILVGFHVASSSSLQRGEDEER